MILRTLSDNEEKIIEELFRRKQEHEATLAYATTTRKLVLHKWNGKHPVEDNTESITLPKGSTLKIVSISRLGFFGLTDDLNARRDYLDCLDFNDASIENIRREI